MAKQNVAVRDAGTEGFVQGEALATLGRGIALVKVAKTTRPRVRPEDNTTALVKKAARALSKPGIESAAVFRGPDAAKVYAYSVYAKDPTKVIREDASGERVIGRLVDGRFRPLKA
jgi:hypothetical protein